ncbi:MAG: hydantoinase/oxoprolinase family protein [Pleurocapsa sp. MO_192.B19]|nr:hydantoinase/oxoprolinase family protein [Pleurocapsa sp. MO_192.B19]
MASPRWQFWIDRGGTFTDIVAQTPTGEIMVHKLLSENPEQYEDAPIQGIRDVMGIAKAQPIRTADIEVIKMGTTVATNALLERKGDRTVLAITKGFKDALRIGYQNRPDIFALEIVLPEMLYEQVVEIVERYDAQGNELIAVDRFKTKQDLQTAYDSGIRSCAIVLMHSYRYPQHELEVAHIARQIGFTQISISHQVSPLIKFISRGDTTVVDAYLSPILRRYVDRVVQQLDTDKTQNSLKLMFMQSNGGLIDAHLFQGKDSILSGPAGGVVGAVKTCALAGFNKIIGFDMGGTSTDVSHYAGEYERSLETEVAGVRLRSPMMSIHTVAAGGGSILNFDGSRYRVGPESAGANPGAAAYGRGGELTVTDCNVMVGKIQPEFFPKVFGINANEPLDRAIVKQKFQALANRIQDGKTPEQVASGFIAIAVDNMANAIKKISLQKGYDVTEYTLCCFGSAGGQHACLIADILGIKRIFIHPYAGVLSAYGMGLADIRIMKQKSIEAELKPELLLNLPQAFQELIMLAKAELLQQQIDARHTTILPKVYLKYSGTDFGLMVDFDNLEQMRSQFEQEHQQRYGFMIAERDLVVETISVELICPTYTPKSSTIKRINNHPPQAVTTVKIYTADAWHDTPIYQRETLRPGDIINSPAIIIEATGTNIIEPGWQGTISDRLDLILETNH